MVGGGGALRKQSRKDSQKLSPDAVRPIDDVVPQRLQLLLSAILLAGQPILVSSNKTRNSHSVTVGLHRELGTLEFKPIFDQQHFVFHSSSSARSSTASSHHPTTTTSSENTIQVTHGCLLLPVMMAAWWYWTKRKARKVLRRLHLMAPPAAGNSMDEDDEDGVDISLAYYQQRNDNNYNSSSGSWEGANDPHHQDQYHTWDDVRHGSNSNDQGSGALRLVQWFKGRGGKTTRNRRRVHANTLHNLRQGPSFLEQPAQQPTPPLDDDDDDDDDDAPGDELVLARGRRRAASVFARTRRQTSKISALHAGILDGSESEEPTWQCIQDTMGGGFCSIPKNPSSSSISSNGGMDMNGRTPHSNNDQHGQQKACSSAATDAVVDGMMTSATATASDSVL